MASRSRCDRMGMVLVDASRIEERLQLQICRGLCCFDRLGTGWPNVPRVLARQILNADALVPFAAADTVPFLGRFVCGGPTQRQYVSAPAATTDCTSGSIVFSRFSIPDFKVTVAEGHPLHDPCRNTFTTPSSNDLYSIAPPSCSTAGFTYSSSKPLILTSISVSSATVSKAASS